MLFVLIKRDETTYKIQIKLGTKKKKTRKEKYSLNLEKH